MLIQQQQHSVQEIIMSLRSDLHNTYGDLLDGGQNGSNYVSKASSGLFDIVFRDNRAILRSIVWAAGTAWAVRIIVNVLRGLAIDVSMNANVLSGVSALMGSFVLGFIAYCIVAYRDGYQKLAATYGALDGFGVNYVGSLAEKNDNSKKLVLAVKDTVTALSQVTVHNLRGVKFDVNDIKGISDDFALAIVKKCGAHKHGVRATGSSINSALIMMAKQLITIGKKQRQIDDEYGVSNMLNTFINNQGGLLALRPVVFVKAVSEFMLVTLGLWLIILYSNNAISWLNMVSISFIYNWAIEASKMTARFWWDSKYNAYAKVDGKDFDEIGDATAAQFIRTVECWLDPEDRTGHDALSHAIQQTGAKGPQQIVPTHKQY